MATEGKAAHGAAPAVRWIDVGEDEAGQRIDNYLIARLKGVPKSRIYRILRSGEVRVNSRRVAASDRVAAGDRIRIPPLRVAQRDEAVPAPHFRLPILHEDEWILAIDKPAGLAVHGGSGVSHGLIERLRIARPDARLLELVHRLDRETSGVLLIAKKRSALVALHAQLREGGTDKRYLALVRGPWRERERTVVLPLTKFMTGEGERRVRVEREGRPARTVFRLQRCWREEPPVALVEAELDTGRTHQIRVHLAHIDHPLAGDDKYGDFAWNRALARRGLKRMFLHAHRIAFRHPSTGAAIAIESALPAELAHFLVALDAERREAAHA